MDAITPSRRTWTPETLERLKAYIDEGKSSGEIALLMERGRGSVCGAAMRAGFKWAREPYQKDVATGARRYRSGIGFGESSQLKRLLKKAKPQSVKLPMPPPTARFIPLIDLDRDHCRWPVCDDPEVIGRQRFCGSPTLDDRSYCAFHYQRATDRSPATLQQERARVS